MKTFTGFTEETAKHLILDAGAFFKNFDLKTDTFDTAVAAGKLIGATKGGGEFSAVPTIRPIEVDGIKGRAKGLEVIDYWDTYIKANILEITKDTIKAALCAADVDEATSEKYMIIKGRNAIKDEDYIENITWVGTLSGSDEPAIIMVKNALNTDGLKLTTQDKSEGVVATTFYGHYDAKALNEPPFEIHYPKTETTAQANTEEE